MKKLSKITSVVLCVAMMLSCVFTGVMTVSAEESAQTIFNAASEFSVENGNVNGVWSYETRKTANPTEFTALNTVGGIAKVASDAVAYSGDVLMMRADTQTDDVVLTFTAPYTGIINLSMANGGVVAPHNSVDGVRLELLHNEEIVKAFYDLDFEYSYNQNKKYCLNNPLAMVVKAGDKVRIAVGRNKPIDGRTYLSPVIKYAEIYKTTYNAFDEFDTVNNPSANGVWKYVRRNNSTATAFTALTYNGASQWSNTQYGCYLQNTMTDKNGNNAIRLYPGGQAGNIAMEPGIGFIAPYTGTISIGFANGGIDCPDGNVLFTMVKNDVVIESKEITTREYVTPDTKTLDVVKGDVVYFVAGRINKGANARCFLNPEITYTDFAITEFNSYNEYDTTQNPNGVWSYKYRANSTATTFGDMTASGEWYEAPNSLGGMVPVSTQNPAYDPATGSATAFRMSTNNQTGEVAIAFTAPYTGTINVKMANGGVTAPYNSVDGVRFTLLKNTTVLESKTDLDSAYNAAGQRYFADVKTYQIDAGDVLYFCIGRNVSTDGRAFLAPVISYTSISAPEVSTGNSYYFSTSGSDSNTGTNEFAPWASLSKLASMNLTAGDRIYLKAGDTWNEQLIINSVNATKENPVVITSYGEGNKPVIDLQLVEDADTNTSELAVPAVTLNNSQGVEIRNLKVTGTGVGIDLHYENSYNNEYVKIANCDFENITGFHQRDGRVRGVADRYYVASAITTTYFNFNMSIKDPALIGLYIEDCKTTNCGSLYVNGDSTVYNLNESGARSVSGLFITNTQMVANDYYGAFINSATGGYMDGCLISACGDAEEFTPGTAGILLATKDFVIQNTTIEGQKRGGVDYDGVGIDFEQGNENVIVRNCYIKDNAGVGVMIYDSNTFSPNVNCKVINNIFENNGFEAKNKDGDFDRDVRIVSGENYSLSASEISGNLFYSDNYPLTHGFLFENQEVTPPVANTITNNNYSDDYNYTPDSALSESVVDEIAEYVGSDYTVNDRKETSVSGEVLSTDVYKHTASEKDSSVWGHKYFAGGWQDMTLVETEDSFYWTYGTDGSVFTSGVTNPAQRETGAISFTAPKSGRIKIYTEGNVISRQCPANWDGVTVSVLNGNNEQVCDQTVLGGAVYEKAFGTTYYNIKAGETIYITFSKNMSNAGDSIWLKPVVEYCYDFNSLNNDETINVIDFIAMNKYMADTTEFDGKFDINGDEDVNTVDLVQLKKYLLGIF